MNDLSFFHTIRILTRCDVTLHQGSSGAIHVDEPKHIAKWIDYHVESEELILQTQPMYYGFLLLNNSYPKIHITCANLNGIQLFDKAYVATMEGFQTEKLGVIIRKSGMVELDLDVRRVDCTVLKSGRIKIKGNTSETVVHVYHDGVYDGASLNASEGRIYLTNNAQASVWVEEEVEAQLLGRSKFSYRGNPRFSRLRVDEGSRIELWQ